MHREARAELCRDGGSSCASRHTVALAWSGVSCTLSPLLMEFSKTATGPMVFALLLQLHDGGGVHADGILLDKPAGYCIRSLVYLVLVQTVLVC